MAEPFKNLVNPALVQAAAVHLARTVPGFDRQRFTQLACDGLEALELKARAMHVASALQATLPADFDRAADAVEAALAPPREALDGPPAGDDGLAGWIVWPLGEWTVRCGMQHPERALQLLHALTQRFTAEWAIRPFIERHPELAWATLQRWVHDPSAHVRRLVSEGSRPRLPWGLQLKGLIADPAPTLPLLQALQDDDSEYVRRSVANHLNDIAKDHPALVAAWLQQHLPGASAQRRALLRHASRTLIKQGDRAVLAAWGLDRAFKGSATLALSPKRVRLGEAFTLSVVLCSSARQAQKLVVDYAVHHVKADGRRTPKVFKGWTLDLPAQATRELQRRHAMREITTRRYHPGRHAVDLIVNGRTLAQVEFDLRAGTAG